MNSMGKELARLYMGVWCAKDSNLVSCTIPRGKREKSVISKGLGVTD